MMKQPTMLTVSVSHGNVDCPICDLTSRPTIYLAAPPVPLPRNMTKMLIKLSMSTVGFVQFTKVRIFRRIMVWIG